MANPTLPGTSRTKKANPRWATLTAKVEKVKDALAEHTRPAKDHVFAAQDAGRSPRHLHFFAKTELARLAGLGPYHIITRCFGVSDSTPWQMIRMR